MKITFVTGPVCAGKTTYVRNRYSRNKVVVLHIGEIIRSMIGMSHAREEEGNTWEVTEPLVRQLVVQSGMIALDLKRDMVVEAFPKSVDQARWLMTAFGNLTATVEIVVLVASHEERMGRLKSREGDEQELFDAGRMARSETEIREVADLLKDHSPFPVVYVSNHDTTASKISG